MGWHQALNKLSEGGLQKSEVKDLADKYDISKKDIKNQAADKGYTLNWQSTGATPDPTYNPGGANSNGVTRDDLVTLYQNIQTGQENLAYINAGASTASSTIRAEADKEVARAYADAQKYSAELGLQGTKYGADKESEWRQAVSRIETQGKLDLQGIINSGLERVAGKIGRAHV